jgi:predicted PurR-regulated permease PerM
MAKPQRDLTRTLLGVLCIGLLIVAALWIVRPFVAAAIWATTIVVVTWPLMLRVQARLWNYRALAVASMITVLILLFVIPLTLAIGAIVANASAIVDQIRSITSMPIPPPPHGVVQLPFIGAALAAAWTNASATGVEGLATHLVPYFGGFTAWLFAEIGSAGYLIIQLLLIPVFAAFMYQYGERYASTLLRFAFQLGGKQGEALIILAGQAIRGVALGVGLTAVIQAALGGIGLALANVPFAGLLTFVLLVLCLAQIGMLVVLIPAAIWVFWSGDPTWGTLLLIWSIAASMLDTWLRPLLVSRSANLPLLLIFVGVIGGFVAFGVLGIFVGPVVLAVAYTFLKTWVDKPSPLTSDAAPASEPTSVPQADLEVPGE